MLGDFWIYETMQYYILVVYNPEKPASPRIEKDFELESLMTHSKSNQVYTRYSRPLSSIQCRATQYNHQSFLTELKTP